MYNGRVAKTRPSRHPIKFEGRTRSNPVADEEEFVHAAVGKAQPAAAACTTKPDDAGRTHVQQPTVDLLGCLAKYTVEIATPATESLLRRRKDKVCQLLAPY